MGAVSFTSLRALVACIFVAALIGACGSEDPSVFMEEGPGGSDAGPPPEGPLIGGREDGGGGGTPTGCKPLTCEEQGVECGPAGDGCGGIIPDCGTCAEGLRCGGPGAHSKCVSPSVATNCTPQTCAEQGIGCGPAGDGCGGIIASCGTCSSGEQCGADGFPSQCVEATATGPGGGACVPKTCADYPGVNCGAQSDGCGGTINCGTCTAPEFCGGGGASTCGLPGGGTCVPKTCADFPGKCGVQPDGCGGLTVNCGSCTLPEVCGGGGVPSVCGGGGPTGPDGGACSPRTTCGAKECGKVADGCGGILDCGVANCAAGEICGGGGVANQCGAPACTPLTKAVACAGLNCGSVSDGCGGVIACGAAGGCTDPEICGGGGTPNVCGGGTVTGPGGGTCTPRTTCGATECGPVADGCGGILDCGNPCTGGDRCGGGGTPSVCGGACTPKTKAAACPAGAKSCGFVADGCGGTIQCGTCSGDESCGVFNPNVCGDGGCTGFCDHIDDTCTAGNKTRITGKVFAPNGTLPLPGALVYVPNGSMTAPYGVTPITDGVAGGTCEQCSTQASGSPLVRTESAYDGSFTLENVPAGVAFPLVIQLGKWRRMVTIPAVTRCTSRTLTSEQTRLPKRQNEGSNGVDNIPFIAVSTGSIDGLECVLRKVGIADDQFGNAPGTSTLDRGRIRLYRRNGARMDGNTRSTDDHLTVSQANLDQFDAVVFGCPAGTQSHAVDAMDRVRAYADKGGRVFATHYEYAYIKGNGPWNDTVTWNLNYASTEQTWTGRVDTGSPKRQLFAQWLDAPGVKALTSTTAPPRVSIQQPRHNADAPPAAGAEEWIRRHTGTDALLHYTFNTPWGAAPTNQCGRVLFSDFHVTIGNTGSSTFPNHCTGSLTNQEKLLAFFLFDLTSCIETPEPIKCTKKTCADYPAGTCGIQSDGCGGVTPNCGTCTAGQTCGGGGEVNVCGGPSCTPKTCAGSGAECGKIPDGCGMELTCGACPPGQVCGGGGVPNKCGAPSCTPLTCAQQGLECGQTGDGCGNVIDCPPCPTGTTCGGGGVPNKCGAPTCTKRTCPAGSCGSMPDGCGGVLQCGDCTAGMTCGGGGAPNVCGAASCSPKTCAQQGAQCGVVSDGCGGVDTCSDCPPGQYCNEQNKCVTPGCMPKTCAELDVECGPTADTCGGLLACGDCPPGTGCGAGGVPGKCGKIACTPKTCAEIGAVCGRVADGCGGLTPSCGDCEGALSCKNGVCVEACKPLACADVGANCGAISDGCGGVVDCGPCPPGQTCGYKQANVCGSSGVK